MKKAGKGNIYSELPAADMVTGSCFRETMQSIGNSREKIRTDEKEAVAKESNSL